MYCSSCGHQNTEGVKFCESCGQPLAAATIPPSVPARVTKSAMSKGSKISSPGAAIAVLCFFLPWILASCGNQKIGSFSGWQLAAGTTIRISFAAQKVPGSPVLFLLLLAGLAVLAIAYFAWQRGHATKVDGGALVGLGVLSLIILMWQFSGAQDDAARQGIDIEFQIGFWGVILGYVAVVVGGVLDLKDHFQSSPPSR